MVKVTKTALFGAASGTKPIDWTQFPGSIDVKSGPFSPASVPVPVETLCAITTPKPTIVAVNTTQSTLTAPSNRGIKHLEDEVAGFEVDDITEFDGEIGLAVAIRVTLDDRVA